MYYGKIRKFDTANGPGIRSTLFVSGCTFNCPGCFNKDSQNFKYGNEFTKDVEDEFISYIKNPNVAGASLLGGEVMQQDTKAILSLLKRIKEETGKSIWCWTGYKYEDLIKIDGKSALLEYIDVLVDGPFEEDRKDHTLKYRGSSNQRVINIHQTLEKGYVCELDFN